MNKTYTIEAPLMQAIVDALASQPWVQVNRILAPLQQVIQSQEAPAPQPATSGSTSLTN